MTQSWLWRVLVVVGFVGLVGLVTVGCTGTINETFDLGVDAGTPDLSTVD